MEKLYNLSAPQKSILDTEQYYNGSSINNIGGGIIVHDTLNFDIFKKAIFNFVKYNDSFRIRLKQTKSGVKQYFEDFSEFDIDIIDLKTEKEVYALDKEILSKPINIFEEKLFEFTIFRLPNNHGGYILKMHHLISDGWTSGLLCRKIMHEYSNLLNDQNTIFNNDFSYINYLESEQKYFSSSKFEKDKMYWEDKFKTIPNTVTIPSIKNSASNFSCEGNRSSFVISKKEMEQISNYCTKHSVSVFNFFMAILSIYISKINNTDDFVIGTPILNRSNIAEKNTAGMFINIAPLRINFENKNTFIDLISSISRDSMGLLRHQKYPYQNLLEDLRKKDSSIPNLYNIVLSYQITRSNNECDIPYDTRWSSNGCTADDFDMHLYDMDEQGILNVAYDYKTCKYDYIDIENIHNRLMHIIHQVLKNNEIDIKDIEIVTPEEKHKILFEFNNTKVDYPKDKTIVDLFEEQVEKTPDNIAVVCNDESLTYRELNERANQLAWYLKTFNIGANDFIGILINRSVELVIGLLAILKAGATYLPIDPDYPESRIKYMLENSQAKLLLINSKKIDSINLDIEKVSIDLQNSFYKTNSKKNLNTTINPNSLAYLIYTSGSTGNPKGVMLKHYNLTNFIFGMKKEIDFSPNKTMVSVTTICFDIFGLELWTSLSSGMKVVIANELEQNSSDLLNTLCIKENVNMIQTTPSRYDLLLNSDSSHQFIENMTEILVGGEALAENILEKLKKLSNAQIYNVYGPTETTIWSTLKNITHSDKITIGKPIINTTCYILDKNQKILPPYIPGELYIGGDGVSNGYLHREELTNEKFLLSPFQKDEIIYNTNDLAYFTNTGEIIHLGRTDFQIKIKGYRVELGEIENKINSINEIDNSVVIANPTKKFLICYYISKKSIDTNSIITSLLETLPHYMIPSYFYKVDKFPLTPNGKIDRKALPIPNFDNFNITNQKIVKPKNDVEITLLKLWKETLNINIISTNNSFFELGGDSLDAINLCTKIFNKFKIQLSVKDIFEHHTISDLSDYISNYKNTKNTITKVKSQDFYPTSSAQKRMYYASKADSEESKLYNIPGALVFDKTPDVEKLKLCFETLFERHESLRTYFEIKNDEIVQKIAPNINFKLDIQNSTSTNTDYLLKQFIKPFNLAKAPLFRSTLVLQPDNKATLLIDMHHSISDGTSVSILLDELSKLYNGGKLEETEITYKDFSEWEKSHFVTSEFKESEKFWVNNFNDELPVLNMPTSFSRPVSQSFEGNSFNFEIDKKLKNKIAKISKDLGITSYMFLLASYYVLLYKYTNQEDIIVGTPVSGRNLPELSNVVGMFVNSLPLRANIQSSISFKTFLNNIKKMCLDSFEHQDYPFDFLVNKLDLQRNPNRNLIFDTMFIFESMGAPTLNFKDINTTFVASQNNISKFDFSLEITPNKENFGARLEYSTKLFNEDFIQKLCEKYLQILNTVTTDITTNISNIEIISSEEKNKILNDFNNTKMPYDKEKNIQTIFEQHAKSTPDKTAIIFENEQISYKELNEKANRLANYLLQNKIKENDIVGIMLPRSIETIICMLGILKAGAGYMLIDYNLPKDRIEFMLNNCNAKLLITNSKMKEIEFNNIYNFKQDDLQFYSSENPIVTCNNENIFSIIYTSGSTGTPKGVTLKRQGVINMTLNYQLSLNTLCCDKFLSISSVAFDMFIVENFVTLLSGATVILTNEEEQKIPELMSELIIKHNIDFVLTTPSRIELLMNNKETALCLKKLKIIQLGGEVFTSTLYNKLKNYTNANIYNGYGPSEITACCSNQKVTKNKTINIGKPNLNTQIYILDKDLNLCPIGIEGEICIAGDGVSKGYINNPEMTKKSFVKNPFGDGMLYKSGDIGKWTQDSEIEYIGRKDFQIKIRGLRVELSEIENKFLEIPKIDNVAVVYKKDENDNYLVGFFTANSDIDTSSIRQEISKSLPLYMVPKYIIKLDKMPITTNGKVNKKELEKRKITKTNKQTYVAPKNELQTLLCDTWNSLLHTKLGIDDNIFESGVDSLIAIKFKTALLSHNINIPYANLFKYPTVRALSENTTLEEKSSNLSDFDYSKIDKILEKNNMETLKSDITHNYKNNILLLGSNGFVGSHILYNFIKQDSGIAYCIIREKNHKSAKARFMDTIHFYFGTELDEFVDNRIIIIQGDITKPNLGLSINNYNDIINKTSIIINSAAMVKHFGNIEKFYDINVNATKNLCDFCKMYDKKLIHISTTSISESSNIDATYVASKKYEGTEFAENNFYIGQMLDNDYTSSKFEAERIILSNMLEGLKAKIIRIGNITNRFSDGKFQINPDNNAFANRLKSFINLKNIPDYLQILPLEFTPVDLCSRAIIYILQNNIKDFSVFHLYNNNYIYLKDFIEILNSNGINIDFVEQKKFKNVIKKILDKSETHDEISGIINDLNDNYELIYEKDIDLSSKMTQFFLARLGFEWPKIDETYIIKYINYMRKINFFKEEK